MKILTEEDVANLSDDYWKAELAGHISSGLPWDAILRTMREAHRQKKKAMNRRRALRSLLKAYHVLRSHLWGNEKLRDMERDMYLQELAKGMPAIPIPISKP